MVIFLHEMLNADKIGFQCSCYIVPDVGMSLFFTGYISFMFNAYGWFLVRLET
jgi:hypothetical protein